jgi:hypothetical protein
MATVTPNFNWPVPTSTDLVKDGATAIEALGDSIDASLVDLKGGTTGQVLSKNSNTDMDFTWVAQDDSNAIQNTIVDAKGDLIGATAADTPARLAVGTDGQILTADSTAATGIKWATPAAATSALTLVKSQTIGSAVSSVTVTDAFSSTYDNYLVIVSGGAGSASSGLNLQLGSTATGYYSWELYGSYSSNTVNGFGQSNTTSVGDFATTTVNGHTGVAHVLSPNLAARTSFNTAFGELDTIFYAGWKNGFVNNNTQYTAFTITPGTGGVTLTGGTIRVYGYQNS